MKRKSSSSGKKPHLIPRLLRWFFYIFLFLVIVPVLAYGVASVYKPRILALVEEELKKNINGEVHIGDLDFTIFEEFPVLSITLSDLYLRGPEYNLYNQNFLSAKKIYIHVAPFKLLAGEVNLRSISIHKGDIFIFRTKEGYTNLDVFRKKDTVTVKTEGQQMISLAVEKILMEDTRLMYFDSTKRKSYGLEMIKTRVDIGQTDTSRLIGLKGPIAFVGLMFNEQKGSYLKDKIADAELNIEFVPSTHRLVIAPSELGFEKSRVSVSGFFNFQQPGNFQLSVQADTLDYKEGLTIVTSSLSDKLKKFNFAKPLTLSLQVDGVITKEGEPKVDITFSTRDNHASVGKLEAENLSFQGSFTNHVDESLLFNDMNSMVTAENFEGLIKGIPVKANFRITNLIDPDLTISSRINMNATDLNKDVDTEKIVFNAGTISAAVDYHGKLKEYLDDSSTAYLGNLSGTIDVSDVAFDFIAKDKKFENTNIHLRFDQKQMDIDRVNLKVNGNPVEIKGSVTGFVPLFFEPEKKGVIKLAIHSSKLDLGTLIKKRAKRKRTSTPRHKRVSEFIDALYSKVEFEIDLKVDELVNGPMHAKNLVGKVKLANDQFVADPMSMNLADGTITMKLKISNLDKEINPVVLETKVKEADIKQLFAAFGNFSQNGITSKNLSGRISATIDMKANVDDKFNLLHPTLRGSADLRIRNGRIQDYPPLEKMSNFLFKNRDFTDVQFAELRTHFKMEGKTFNISRMEIESSVLTLFLEGRYSLANDTDISIQVPLSNLKKRKKDYKPENVGVDAKVGPSVYLRAHHKDGALVIGYDPLKKFRKN